MPVFAREEIWLDEGQRERFAPLAFEEAAPGESAGGGHSMHLGLSQRNAERVTTMRLTLLCLADEPRVPREHKSVSGVSRGDTPPGRAQGLLYSFHQIHTYRVDRSAERGDNRRAGGPVAG